MKRLDPENYPDGNDPVAVAEFDTEEDVSVVLDADWTVERAVFR